MGLRSFPGCPPLIVRISWTPNRTDRDLLGAGYAHFEVHLFPIKTIDIVVNVGVLEYVVADIRF